jgi:hypothetical protein
LGAILLAGFLAWLLSLDSRLWEIEAMLENDPELADYPYQFQALSIEGRTAIMSTVTLPTDRRIPTRSLATQKG